MNTDFKYGQKVRHKNDLYFIDTVGVRTLRARRVFDIDQKYNPNGSLSNVLTTLNKKEIKRF